MPKLKIPHATTKTWHSHINKYINTKKKKKKNSTLVQDTLLSLKGRLTSSLNCHQGISKKILRRMSEHFSCKECTWFAPNSANYRESHPEYQASSSKRNSRFPKACHQVQTSVPPFMLTRNVSKTARGTLQMVQKKTLSSWKKPGIPEVSTALCSPSLYELLLDLHNSWPLSNHKPPD